MKPTKKGRLAIVIISIFLIILTPFFAELVDRSPTIPRQEKVSMTALIRSIHFPLYYPSEAQLSEECSTIKYYVTTVPHPSRVSYSKPIVTGYSIMTYPIGKDPLFRRIEYRGTNIAKEAGQWALFDEINYTCIAKDVLYSSEKISFSYSEYRRYPSTPQECEAQKQGDFMIPSKSTDHEFTIFIASVDCDGIRYSVVLSELDWDKELEKKCIQEASRYFNNLLRKENLR